MIDVIINCFNDEDLVSEAIQSVIDQTSYDLISNIIVVDDGSTDNTKEVIESFNVDKITYIYQENQGLAAARNFGIEYTTSTFVAFLDSDDIWDINKISKVVEALNINPEIEMIYHNVVEFYGELKGAELDYYQSISYEGRDCLSKYFVNDAPVFPSAMIINRELLNKIGRFDPYFRKGQDTEICYRIFANAYVSHLNDYLTFRRLNPSVSLGGDVSAKESYLQKAAQIAIDKNPELKRYYPHKLSNYYYMCGREKIEKFKDMKTGRNFIVKAIKARPISPSIIIYYYFLILFLRQIQKFIKR